MLAYVRFSRSHLFNCHTLFKIPLSVLQIVNTILSDIGFHIGTTADYFSSPSIDDVILMSDLRPLLHFVFDYVN